MNKNIKKIIAAVLTAMTIFMTVTGYVSAENAQENATVFNGSAVEPEITLFSASGQLVNGTDFDVAYSNNINVGTAEAKITFKGNYTGERTVTFQIVARELSSDMVSFTEILPQTYTGKPITPEPVIKYGNVELVKGTDYELSYVDNENVGTGTVKVTFTGNYTGSASTTFEITPKSVTESEDIVIDTIPDQTYTGEALTPVPVITDKSR